MSKIIPISRLRVNQRFSWVPATVEGPFKLTYKSKHKEGRKNSKKFVYSLRYARSGHHPLGTAYRLPSDTKVRLLKPKKNGLSS